MIPTSICRAFQLLDDRLFHTNVPGGQWFSDDEIAWLRAEFEWHRRRGVFSEEFMEPIFEFTNQLVDLFTLPEQPRSLDWLDRWRTGLWT
jgi:hypothetical protein